MIGEGLSLNPQSGRVDCRYCKRDFSNNKGDCKKHLASQKHQRCAHSAEPADLSDDDDSRSHPVSEATPTSPIPEFGPSLKYPTPKVTGAAEPPIQTTSKFDNYIEKHFVDVASLATASNNSQHSANGYPTIERRKLMQIGLTKAGNGKSQHVVTLKRFARHTVIAVEGDPHFRVLLREGLERNVANSVGAAPPCHNCRFIALHCGTPASPHVLRAVVTTTVVPTGTSLVVLPSSVERCADEFAWYKKQHPELSDAAMPLQEAPIENWPRGVAYYHGIGEEYRSKASQVRHCFPNTLLRVQPCQALGAPHLEVVAQAPIPYGTCFAYCGPLALVGSGEKSTKSASSPTGHPPRDSADGMDPDFPTLSTLLYSNAPSSAPEDAVASCDYLFEVGRNLCILGQCVTRYINHRFNFDAFGNVEFITMLVADESMTKHQKRMRSEPTGAFLRLAGSDDCVLVIPAFIATRDISQGEMVLAKSYGSEFDAVLERSVTARGNIYSLRDAPLVSLHMQRQTGTGFEGIYQAAIERGRVVYVRDPWRVHAVQLYYVEAVCDSFLRISELLRCVPMRGEETAEWSGSCWMRNNDRERTMYVTTADRVALLLPELDYDVFEGSKGRRIFLRLTAENSLKKIATALQGQHCAREDTVLMSGEAWATIAAVGALKRRHI